MGFSPSWRRTAATIPLWLVACLVLALASGRPAHAAQDRLLPLEATVNGAKGGTWLLLERDGVLYAPRDAFDEWRLQLPPDAKRVEFKGQSYAPLAAIPGFKAKVDVASQSVELLFAPQAFSASRLTRETVKAAALGPVLPSLFFNYDLSYTGSSFRDTRRIDDFGALNEVGASLPWGVLTSTGVARNIAGDPGLDSRRYIRLETTFTRDFPASNVTLRVGDTTTRPTMWGNDVYFGGLRIGTNFALTPGYMSQPLPVLGGLSSAPSTVELYVNDVLRQVSSVPTGPFAIDNLPALTGNGEAKIVVRDLLGRETVIVQSFFSANQLLAAGLDDWSVEGGSLRHDLGLQSMRYGAGFASGTWRRGLTNETTLEGRAEVSRDNQLVGLGGITTLPGAFIGRAAFAASDAKALGQGSHWLAGLERTGLATTLSLQAQGSTHNFRQLGDADDRAATRLQVAGNASYSHERLGTVGLGLAMIRRYDDEKVTTITGNYSVRVGQQSSLSINVSRAVDGISGTAVGITFVMPLERNRVASGVANSHGKQHDLYATASQNPGTDTGLGWRALAGEIGSRAHAEAGLYYLGNRGTLSGDASVSSQQKTVRLGASGGLAVADGHAFATPHLDQSFAVVEVPGYADLGVGLGGNVVARTDASGVAIIPHLLPYQANAVRLNPAELPVSADIDNIEQLAVPAWRSAVKVAFPVRGGRGALLRIVLDDGEVAPAGATVEIEGDSQSFFVARRGEAFVTGLQPTNRLRLKWRDQSCVFDVALPPPNADEIPRLGPLACHGASR